MGLWASNCLIKFHCLISAPFTSSSPPSVERRGGAWGYGSLWCPPSRLPPQSDCPQRERGERCQQVKPSVILSVTEETDGRGSPFKRMFFITDKSGGQSRPSKPSRGGGMESPPLRPSFPKRRALIESFRSLPSPSSRLPQFSISLLSSLSPSLNQVKEEERTRHSIRQGDVVASYET